MHTRNWRLWAADLSDTVLEKPTAQSEGDLLVRNDRQWPGQAGFL